MSQSICLIMFFTTVEEVSELMNITINYKEFDTIVAVC